VFKVHSIPAYVVNQTVSFFAASDKHSAMVGTVYV